MLILKKIRVLLVCFIIVFGFIVRVADCLAGQNSLKLSVVLDKEEYGPDEAIKAVFKLRNDGKGPVYVNKRFYLGSESMPKEQRDLYLIVTVPSGAKLSCKFTYEAGYPKTDYFELLEPGKEVVSEYPRDLRGFFDFNDPGVYKISAVYQNVYGREIGLDVFKDQLSSKVVSFKIVKE